jgi:translation initiation factor IF-1
MVKNIVGGCKSKKLARKLSTPLEQKKEYTRLAIHELELYAIVLKMYGNGRCQVKTHNGLELQCVIRNKFKGRSKRGNIVIKGSYILVGLREWEKTSGYKTCDLLEVYEEENLLILKQHENFKLLTLLITTTHEDDFFSLKDNGILGETENTPIVENISIILNENKTENTEFDMMDFQDI